MEHKHADLMKLYAEDAKETNKPWERWEVRCSPNREWRLCRNHPTWITDCEYQHKPQK